MAKGSELMRYKARVTGESSGLGIMIARSASAGGPFFVGDTGKTFPLFPEIHSWTMAACASCHSPNGAGMPAQYPRLSGQHADYTASQLVQFRDGVRKNNVQMTQVAAKMNDREIKAVADYIAGLR